MDAATINQATQARHAADAMKDAVKRTHEQYHRNLSLMVQHELNGEEPRRMYHYGQAVAASEAYNDMVTVAEQLGLTFEKIDAASFRADRESMTQFHNEQEPE